YGEREERACRVHTEQLSLFHYLSDAQSAGMEEHACPYNRPVDYWDLEVLGKAYERQFGIPASGIESFDSRGDLAKKLYDDVEAILLGKMKEFGVEYFLRL